MTPIAAANIANDTITKQITLTRRKHGATKSSTVTETATTKPAMMKTLRKWRFQQLDQDNHQPLCLNNASRHDVYKIT